MPQYLDPTLLADVATHPARLRTPAGRVLPPPAGKRPRRQDRDSIRQDRQRPQAYSYDNARQGDPGRPAIQVCRWLSFSRADAERPYRAIQSQETARQSNPRGDEDPAQADRTRRRDLPGVRAVHSMAHISDPLGAAHGPMDARLPCRAPRHQHQEASRPSGDFALDRAREFEGGYTFGHTARPAMLE
jgi:hypothetical protein